MPMIKPAIFLGLAFFATGCSGVFKQDFEVANSAAAVATVAPQAKETFFFEAESGSVAASGENTWEIISDGGASGAEMLRKVGGDFYAEARQGPSVTWTFDATAKANYDVWLRAKPNAAGDSLFFSWLDESTEHHWGADVLDQWVWTKLRTVAVRADESYQFSLWAREDLIEVDQLLLQTAGAAEPKVPE